MKIYVSLDIDSKITGWGSSRSNENDIELEIKTDHQFFKDNPFTYKLINGELMKDDIATLNIAKRRKMKELSAKCEETILGKFSVTLDGILYEFSNDSEAQMNFEKTDRAFEKSRITEITWTTYLNDNTTRIILDSTDFEIVYMAHLNHIQDNISKFRDILQPQVESATTIEEINSIMW